MTAGPVHSPEAQAELLEAPPTGGPTPQACPPLHLDTHDRMTIDLGSLGAGLRALARQQRTNVSALIRRALRPLLDDGKAGVKDGPSLPAGRVRFVRINLKLPHEDAMELSRRAHAADVSRSELVRSLLEGVSPPALAPGHWEAVRALLASNDRMAVLCVDVRDFVRLLKYASTARAELEPYRARIANLENEVREHLKLASVLADALRPYQRRRG